MELAKEVWHDGLTYTTVDRIIKCPISRLFLSLYFIFFSFITFLFHVAGNRFLRTQPSEEEISFFTDVEEIMLYKFRHGTVAITNLRIIWYDSVDPSNNF
jgi:hypothetical protein